MIKQIITFFKKTHRAIIIILTTVIFFLGYNTYLVDYSLVNLRTTLVRINNIDNLDDAKKLIPLLDDSLLEEVVSRELKVRNVSYAELARNVLSESSDASQLADVRFALREAITQKEKERSPALSILDKIFAPAAKMPPKAQLEKRANNLKRSIAASSDKRILQSMYYDLAGIYLRLGRLDSAKQAYREAVSLNPKTKLAERAKFNLAWNEKFQGNLNEALSQFEALTQTADQKELGTFSRYQMAEIYKLQGDYEKAIAVYKEIAEKYPDSELNKLSEFQICYVYLHGLKKYDEAEDAFAKISDVCKGTDLSERIAKTKLFNITRRYDQMGFDMLRDGYMLHSVEKYKEALAYFDKALKTSSKDGIARVGKSLAYLWLNQPDRAMEFARDASRVSQRNEFVVVNLCYVYLQLGLIDDALAACKRFIAFRPKSFRVFYNMGFIYILQNKPKEAAAAFFRVTKLESKFAPAYNNLGYCLWQLKKYSDAIKAFEETVDIEPGVLEGHFNLGLAYAEIGRYTEAEKKFTEVLEVSPQHFEAQVCLREIKRIIKERSAVGVGSN